MREQAGTVVSVFGVRPCFLGGNETFIHELSVQLDRHGWSNIVCFDSEPPEAIRNFLDLPRTHLEVVDTRSGEIQTLLGLRRVLTRHRPDILHLHYTKSISAYPWLAKICGVKHVVLTDHGSRPEDYAPRRAPLWKRAAARVILHPLSAVVSVSDFCMTAATDTGTIPANRLRRIYNGVSLSRVMLDPEIAASFRRSLGIPPEATLVTQLSWMIPAKGCGDFLHAAQRACSRDANLRFLIGGEGTSMREFIGLAESLGIRDRVVFAGRIDDPFASGLFAATDILCQFSRWNEAFGWSMTEAMAHGKPVIATRVGAIPEVVENGITGILVERGNHEAMADAILRLAADPALRRQFGTAGRQRVDERFEISNNVAKLLEVYGIQQSSTLNTEWALHKIAGSRY